jgi:glycosyltransferase involved in cell wall biosynthesis
MKVLVVNNVDPFVWGGAEELASNLCSNLILYGHEAEVLRIPFQWEPFGIIPSQMLIADSLELWNVDHIIALKFPAYLVRHPSKAIWLLHQYRQAYDMFDLGQTNIPSDSSGRRVQSMIRSADEECFAGAKAIYVNSDVTRDRLLKYNGLSAEVLRPPVNDPELFCGGPVGSYVFCGGRVNSMKRQHLLVEALAMTTNRVRLVIAGPPDSPADRKRVECLVEKLGVGDRVSLDLRFLSREEYAGYVNGAAAVAYIPHDEDSVGYVAMEAATAAKALITTTDSGGVMAMIEAGSTGWAALPTVESLADALEAGCGDETRARSYGENLRAHWNRFGTSWARVIEALVP